ncbi:MAG: MotA/TolQ/ExbB proton channel family protein [Planctomycetota bacterium]|nr:MotA/TolQ/ExbB proton channel family protein [Planctomycetota bacterium]
MSDLLVILDRYVAAGGAVMLPLLACAVVLWYAVGYRAFLLRRGTTLAPRPLLASRRGAASATRGLIDGAAAAVVTSIGAVGSADLRRGLEDALAPWRAVLDRGAALGRTVVAVAPLLGLLGTVSGMIELFDSLGSGTFHAQEGGIAGGISEALFTTQLGLGVAIPGYFATRLLDRRAARLRAELDELRDVAIQEARA